MADMNDVNDLFEEAVEDGLDEQASQIMVANLDAVALAGCQGTEIDLIPEDEVTLVSVIHDGSGSMDGARDVVVQSYEGLLDALRGSKKAESIFISDWIFNTQSDLVHDYLPVEQAPNLDNSYFPNGGTALYDTVLKGLSGIVAYGQQLRSNGVRTKNVVVVFSDGEDNSSRVTSTEVRKVTKALLSQETFILAYVGFTTYGMMDEAEVQRLADEIGFNDVIAVGTSPSEIRKIFQQVSDSIIQVSQSAVSSGGFFAAP